MNIGIEQAAKTLLSFLINDGYSIRAIHEYTDLDGKVLYCRIRLIHGDDSKTIRPIHLNEGGQYVVGEPSYITGSKPLYNLHNLSASSYVHVVEGETCADALIKLGITATTSGSWNSASYADWTILSGKDIVIWPDADQQGEEYARMVVAILLQMNCKVYMVDITKINLSKSEDCVDWIYKHPNTTKQDLLNLPVIECTVSQTVDEGATKSKMLLDLVSGIELFHNEQGVAYATVNISGREETMPIRSENFLNWLSQLYWHKYQEPLSNFIRTSAVDLMEAKARYEGKCHEVFSRVGKFNGETYIYLANESNQVVRISCEGWEVLNSSPVKFVKNRNMRALPVAAANGNINLLWKYVNIPDKYKILVIAWLIECLRLDTEFPILFLHGCQGSAKSTSQEFLRSIIDPNASNLRGAPRNADDIIIAAANNYVISYNNISNLTKSNQDDLCAVSTGGGVGRRKIYTDLEESLCEIKRPLIMNGIHNPISARDLTSRCIVIELPELNDSCRKSGSELRDAFIQDQPFILSGLYELYVSVINMLPNIRLFSMPRLADFALLGTALERALDLKEGAFLSAFNNNIEDSMHNTLDSQPILWSLNKLIDDKLIFRGTFAQLLDELNNQRYKGKSAIDWPGSAKALAHVLKDVAPIIWKMNMTINFVPTRSNKGKVVEINRL